MSDIKALIELAKNRLELEKANPSIDRQLLEQWELVSAGRPRPSKQYQLQRAFDDGPKEAAQVVARWKSAIAR